MGFSTRSYARPYIGGGLPGAIKILLIANTAVFVLQLLGLDKFLVHYFALRPSAVVFSFAIWQLATYTFLHGGFMHILFNMLALWMFGREIEEVWGRQRFMRFYFICAIGAGICILLANYLIPSGRPDIPTIGASGAVFGVMLVSAMLWPDRIVYFNFLFPIKMKYLVMIYGAIAFYSSADMNSGVSNIGHVGGLLTAFIYMKTPRLRRWDPLASARYSYSQWKLARAKKKFQVYMRKQGSNRDIN